MSFEDPLKTNNPDNLKSGAKTKKRIIKALALAGIITAGTFVLKNKKEQTYSPPPDNENQKELVVNTNKISTEPELLTPEETELESKRQKGFYEEYVKEYKTLYGDRLYSNQELLSPDFQPENFKLTAKVRFLQYFLHNGREKTLKDAEKLGCKYHQTKLSSSDSITQIFKEAGMDMEGEIVEWVEVPEGRSGGEYRDGNVYGGKSEVIMIVEGYKDELDDWTELPAQKAGYKVDKKNTFAGVVANEMSHEIQHKYFPQLFGEGDFKRIGEPFKSFKTDIPNLRFQNNAQAAEFLSDVANWSAAKEDGVHFRFFNSLGYMSKRSWGGGSKDDRYWYSYQVQNMPWSRF